MPWAAGVDVEVGAPLVTELPGDDALPEAVLAPEAVELPLPAPLPPLVVVAAAPDTESVAEADWVPLTEVGVALTIAVVVALPAPMAPLAGLPSAVTVK